SLHGDQLDGGGGAEVAPVVGGCAVAVGDAADAPCRAGVVGEPAGLGGAPVGALVLVRLHLGAVLERERLGGVAAGLLGALADGGGKVGRGCDVIAHESLSWCSRGGIKGGSGGCTPGPSVLRACRGARTRVPAGQART